MSSKLTIALCVGVLGMTGCTQMGGLFGKDKDMTTGAASAASGASGLGTGQLGAIEESSIAFFNTSIGDRVLFLVDQSTLTPNAIATLDGQAQWLNANPGHVADIQGHADEQGTRDYNLALSAKRASAVQNYLISKGVAASRLSITPFGKERPLATCSDETCWSQNRRAVTVVAGGGFAS